MPLFGKKPKSAPAAPAKPGLALREEPYRGTPEVPAWRDAPARGEWRDVEAGLVAEADPDRRSLVVDRLVDKLDRVPALDAWVDGTGSATAYLVRGAHSIRWAWEARSGRRAEYVEREAFDVFHARLRGAEDDLARAADLAPDDPVPWVFLLTSARGLQITPDEEWARWRRVTSLSPVVVTNAADQMLQNLCDKWGGSHDAMFEFARGVSAAAPAGHPVHRVVPMAVVERHIACKSTDEWRAVRAAAPYAQWVADAAARSVDLPGFGPRPGGDPQQLVTRNVFAAGFASLDDLPRLRQELETIGPDVTEWPWAIWRGKERVAHLRRVVSLD